nr:uncharacterized protein LOC106016837 isoform X2 [Anas platyrhynchos]XP_038039220.1 uncharacterized protein LOC106016837 isoform X2 [Anas platyrhynchos]XP_038039221.1 uncharacterized protein LOC106016837 isoform X2 [Anas platyrhynchos]XP_038039222.1 uncharacterized protein LOC106016837 isoform X2 [Anas platyrhynchos]XP_038039223.1 uncharacterized protein LOC106016837 isoform X2 [Anas platyrhynchos]
MMMLGCGHYFETLKILTLAPSKRWHVCVRKALEQHCWCEESEESQTELMLMLRKEFPSIRTCLTAATCRWNFTSGRWSKESFPLFSDPEDLKILSGIFDTGKKNSLCPDEKEKDCMSVSLVAFLHLLTKSSGICVLRASGRALEHNVPALGSGRSSVLLTSLLEVESPGRSRAARLPLLVQLETKYLDVWSSWDLVKDVENKCIGSIGSHFLWVA